MTWLHSTAELLAPYNDWIGNTAALLTTGAFLPQALHTLRSRDVRGISLSMYLAFTAGIALWLVYGCLLGAAPLIAANAVTLALSASILAMKIRFGRSS